MKKKAFKTAVLIVEIAALAIAIAAAALVYVYWRSGQGPVSLNLFRSSAELAIERRLPSGFDARIESIEIERSRDNADLSLRLHDLNILDAEENSAAFAPEIFAVFQIGDLLRGEVGPQTLVAEGATFKIIRRENQNVEIPVAKTERKKSAFPGISSLIDGGILKSAFESAELNNAEVLFLDAASGRSWSAPDTQIYLKRNASGLAARVSGAIEMDGASATLAANAEYIENSGVIDVLVNGERFPIGDILSMFYGDRASIIEAPVSGVAELSFTPEGDVLASKFDATVGAGHLTLGGARRRISEISWVAGFDPESNHFSLERFLFDVEGARGDISGNIVVSFGEDIRKPQEISFNLQSSEIAIASPDYLEGTLAFQDNQANGLYRIEERRLHVKRLKTSVEEMDAVGSVSFHAPREGDKASSVSPGVIADIRFDGSLNPARLLNLWPKEGLANGARDWVEERLEAAHIENIMFKMDMAPGAIAEDGALPDDAMELTFNARNVMAHYVNGMTPLRNGSGSGVLRGNSFLLNVKNAEVGEVDILKGEVSFPEFMPKWRPTYYRFTAQGDARAILGILDEKPMTLLTKVNLSPDQFSGEAQANVEIMRPNKRDVASHEYGYKGIATFDNLAIDNLVGGIKFTNAKGQVDLKTRSMTVTADARLEEEAPIELVWTQRFFREDGPSELDIAGTFDSTAGDLFGISPRQFVRGPVYFKGRAIGELGAFQSLDLDTDFSDASMSFEALGWRKPANMPASGTLKMRFEDDGVFVDSFAIEADNNAHVEGAMVFNAAGALRSASITDFSLSEAADLTIRAERDAAGVLVFTAVGPFLNAAPMIEQMLGGANQSDGEPFPWGQGIAVNARIDRMAMRNDVQYLDGALDMLRDAENLRALDFTAFDESGTPLKVTMSMTGAEEGPQRMIEAETKELGGLMSGLFGLNSVHGGEGIMRLMLHPEEDAGFSGEIEAREMQVINAPLLARILSAGSLDGLANLLSGEGIEFDYAAGEFEYSNGELNIDDLQATGSSVGISVDGAVGFGAGGQTRLNGAVAPLYMLNSILGFTPIIGDLLVGKKGEGIVAFTYNVSGETASPQVTVNPLSALTPGIFRRILRPQTPVETAPAPPAEEQAPTDNQN
ncbi:DUF3971 domain-containing protein [Hyphococcus flavus]|uniref:DUF3971 domain-containing protein n=1 Tax=Hyphococcus flavus TaxID=1866326 RepID=A0AAE9ZCK4_9PROT|nr:DUF3971 domain-containing protein [Hyphococcus flavus]WDI31996.1 DUF3971 domain-containing protein [Hyphococcus flavus]